MVIDEETHQIFSTGEVQTIPVPRGYLQMFSLNIQMDKQLHECNKEDKLVTKCLLDFYDKEFGHVNDYKMAIERDANYSMLKSEGYSGIKKLTGCQKPCSTYKYTHFEELSVPVTHQLNAVNDPITIAMSLLKESGSNGSSFITLNYQPPIKYKVTEEHPAYTAITFISEVGGIVGIFVGLSFWSIYEAIIALIARLAKMPVT